MFPGRLAREDEKRQKTLVMLSGRLPIIATGVFVRNDASTTEWSQTMGLNREDKATVIAEISEVVSN